MQPLKRFENANGIDLIDAGDIGLFMVVKDNLYKISVDKNRKNYPISRQYERLEKGLRPIITSKDLAEKRQARYVLYHLFQYFVENIDNVSFLDVGAFVGDVSLRYALFSKDLNKKIDFHCFDPTISGDLIPFNAQINGLDEYIKYHPVAIGEIDGFVTFLQRNGFSDSSRFSAINEIANTIVPSLKLSTFIKNNNIKNAIYKLDTENLESVILNDIKNHINESFNALLIEYHISQENVRKAVVELRDTHYLWDVGYVPRPFCCNRIENFDEFNKIVKKRKYGYTDVMAISKNSPNINKIIQILDATVNEKEIFTLIY